MKTIKAIEVNAKEWFDRLNGNSYFAGNIYVEFTSGKIDEIIMPYQYGYGEQYLQEAKSLLTELNYITTEYGQNLVNYCRDNNISLNRNLRQNCLKKELKAFEIKYNQRVIEIRKEII